MGECQNSETPELIDTKFVVGDYVGTVMNIIKYCLWVVQTHTYKMIPTWRTAAIYYKTIKSP